MENPSPEGHGGGKAGSRGFFAARIALLLAGGVTAVTLALPEPGDRRCDDGGDGGCDAPSAEDEAYTAAFVHRFKVAQRRLGAGNDAEAERILAELLAEQPGAAAVHHALAHLRWHQRKFDAALAGFRRAADLAPDDGAIRRDLGFRLLEAGLPAEASGHLDAAAELIPPDLETEVARGRCSEHFGRSAEAEARYRTALGLDPGSIDARCALAGLIGRTDPKAALEVLGEAPDNWADVLLVRGQCHARLGDAAEATRRLRRLPKVVPPGPAGIGFLREGAATLVSIGDAEGAADVAAAWCEAETKAGGRTPLAAFTLAVARAGKGDVGAAASAVSALDSAPLSAAAPAPLRGMDRLVRAHLLLATGDRPAASKVLDEAASLDGAPFERAAARRILAAEDATTLAAALAAAAGDAEARRNDVLWIEGLAAAFAGDRERAAARFRDGASASRPAGEHPGLLFRLAPLPPTGE